MPALFFGRGFTLFSVFGGEVRDFDADGFCQVEGGVVEVELAVGLPEVQDVALGLETVDLISVHKHPIAGPAKFLRDSITEGEHEPA